MPSPPSRPSGPSTAHQIADTSVTVEPIIGLGIDPRRCETGTKGTYIGMMKHHVGTIADGLK